MERFLLNANSNSDRFARCGCSIPPSPVVMGILPGSGVPVRDILAVVRRTEYDLRTLIGLVHLDFVPVRGYRTDIAALKNNLSRPQP